MKVLLLSSFILVANICNAQNTFQRLYVPAEGDAQTFGCYQLDDGGFIFTGIITEGVTSKVFMTRVNCEGNVAWSKTYNSSSTWGNISQRVIQLRHRGFCLAASVGTYNAYDILVVKTDNNGNTIWQKIMQGNGDDLVNGGRNTIGRYCCCRTHEFVRRRYGFKLL